MATLNTQNSYTQAFGVSQTVTLTGVAAGDTLIVTVRERDQSAEPTLSDTVNGAWGASVVTRNTTAVRVSLFAFHNSGSGNPVITIDYGASNRVFQGIAAAFTPAGGSTLANDQTNTAGSSSVTSHNAGSITAGAGFIVAASGFTPDSGGETIGDSMTAFTMVVGEREYHRYKLTSGETLDGDFTTTNAVSGDHVIASFLESGGGAPRFILVRPA